MEILNYIIYFLILYITDFYFMKNYNLDNKKFALLQNSEKGTVDSSTQF